MSTAPKSTPGPWRVGLNVAHTDGPHGVQVISENLRAIAMAYQTNEDQQRANAVLIAAAPELAEALRELHDYSDVLNSSRHMNRSRMAFGRASKLLERLGY